MRPLLSHSYKFTPQDLLTVVGLPILVLGAFALAVHLAVRLRLGPEPRPILDTDRTILIHQAAATRRRQSADIVCIGDSSCLMDVSAKQLTAALPGHQLLNLGTLSYLDLNAFGLMLQQYVEKNAGQLRTVVLLMHPEALRRPAPAEYDVEALESFFTGRDTCSPALSPVLCWLGIESFRGRVISRVIPQPLPGAYGRQYGFTHDLWNYLSAHQGSAVDPGQFDPRALQGNTEYRLAKSLEVASRSFRVRLPAGTRLIAGVTPIPQSLAGPDFDNVRQQLLRDWNNWLGADSILTNLPARAPDAQFASKTHLNSAGIRWYTEQLGHELARVLRDVPAKP